MAKKKSHVAFSVSAPDGFRVSIHEKLGDDYYALLGQIAVYTEILAFNVDAEIWRILLRDLDLQTQHRVGKHVTRDMDFAQKIRALENLGLEFYPRKRHVTFKKVVKLVRNASEIRNKRVHALWSTSTDENGITVTTRHGRAKDKEEKGITLKTLRDDVRQIQTAWAHLKIFTWGHNPPGQSPGK